MPHSHQNAWRKIPAIILCHFWFKCLGTTLFIAVFFAVYIYLLRHPAFPVTEIPASRLDDFISVQPLALPIYLSLWFYLSLPPMLMTTRAAIVEYGFWIGSLCLAALAIFYFWPTAVPDAAVDWSRYPGMAFLKGMDAAGNACPSLHVATAVFSGLWLDRDLLRLGLGRAARYANVIWCLAIIYSTLATKQHMAVDAVAGIILSFAFFFAFRRVKERKA
ncbi:MAG: phosphatase PAP2 family protein [Azonexus sp.]|jgi:hypothetical protein|nr:phosphatase PAP2 family protein [Azonexus sp.]